MKKSLVALAVLSSLGVAAAAQADTTLYGTASMGIAYNKSTIDPATGKRNNTWKAQDNSSLFGIQGSEDLGDGLFAVYRYEFAINQGAGVGLGSNSNSDGASPGQRKGFVGLKGGFGEVKLGRLNSGYDDVHKAPGYEFIDGRTKYDFDRISNSLQYMSPSFGGFVFTATGQFNGSTTKNTFASQGNKNGLDSYEIAGTYTNGPLSAAVGFASVLNGGVDYKKGVIADADVWGAGVSYAFGPATVYASYEKGRKFAVPATGITNITGSTAAGYTVLDAAGNVYANSRTWQIGADYTFGSNIVRGNFSQAKYADDYGLGADPKRYIWGVGFEHFLSKRTSLWAEYQGVQKTKTNGVSLNGTDDSTFIAGMTHKF